MVPTMVQALVLRLPARLHKWELMKESEGQASEVLRMFQLLYPLLQSISVECVDYHFNNDDTLSLLKLILIF